MNMKCKKSRKEKPQPAVPAKLTAKEIRDWEKTSEKLSDALKLLENYPVPYPPECLPVVIF